MDTTYATIRHHTEFHSDRVPLFTFHHLASYQTATERQIRESIYIDTYKCDNILNGKGEWGSNLIPRAKFEDDTGNKTSTKLNRNSNTPQSVANATPLATETETERQNNFEMSYTQRRKRKRLEERENNLTVYHHEEMPIERRDSLGGNKAGNSAPLLHQCGNKNVPRDRRQIVSNPTAGDAPNKLVQACIGFRNGGLRIVSHKPSHSGSTLTSKNMNSNITSKK